MAEKNCKSCRKPIAGSMTASLILSFYVLGSSIYGTIEIIKKIISLF